MKAVYIMSSPRGGSTLLSLVLGRHPEIANLGEVSFIPKLLSLDELCTCQQQLNHCPEWANVFQSLANNKKINMASNPYGLHLDDAMKQKSGTGKIDHNYQTQWRMTRSKIRGGMDSILLKYLQPAGPFLSLPSIKNGADNTLALYQAAADVWQKSVVVDASKLPRKAIHLYKQSPETVRIIHLTRDSRGVSASNKATREIKLTAERWRYYHSMSLDLIDKWVAPEHVKRFKYEDFVNAPELRLRELCEWLEIPYSEQALDFDTTIESHSAGGNPTRFKFADGIRPVDDRWKTVLTEADIEVINSICGDVSRKLGY